MSKRKKYAINHNDGTVSNVFADDINVTQAGDIVFNQVRDGEVVNQDGSSQRGMVLEVVLIIRNDNYTSIAMVNDKGVPMVKESGLIGKTGLVH